MDVPQPRERDVCLQESYVVVHQQGNKALTFYVVVHHMEHRVILLRMSSRVIILQSIYILKEMYNIPKVLLESREQSTEL